jgi:adenylate cyclase
MITVDGSRLTAMLAWTVRGIERISQIGAAAADSDEMRLRRGVGVTSVVLGGVPLGAGYGLLFLALDQPIAGAAMLGGASLMLLGVLGFSRSRNFAFYNVYWLLITNLMAFGTSLSLGGFLRDGLFTFWGILVPIIAAITNTPRHALAWFALFALEIVTMLAMDPWLRAGNALSAPTIAVLSAVNLVSFAGFVLAVVILFVLRQRILLRLVSDEKRRSDALLLNILPREIAEQLRGERRLIADRYAEVSVLFADIVGFTPLSTTMPPLPLVELLNDVFSYFDTLVDEYGLEKIKTIGDCYMVAAGAPRLRPDHAQVLARMALRIQAEMQTRSFGQGIRLSFRIGINSGPVVAGVIGSKKFIYDLWGDAVNTASRMESHGSAGAIQITEATYQRIAAEFTCEPRGTVEVKGKGAMPVWFVTAERAPT